MSSFQEWDGRMDRQPKNIMPPATVRHWRSDITPCGNIGRVHSWLMFNPRLGEETHFWNATFESRLPGFLKGLMVSSNRVSWFQWSLFADTLEDQSSFDLALSLQGLMADSQMSCPHFLFANKASFQIIRSPAPLGTYFTSSDGQLNWNIFFFFFFKKRNNFQQRILK